jgi:hypothetical protein
VHGNQLTTLGFAAMMAGDAGNNVLTQIVLLLQALSGTVVTIFNLGASIELPTTAGGLSTTSKVTFGVNAVAFARPLSASGPVLFNDNQVMFESGLREAPLLWTSTMIFTFDDVSYNGNQTACRLGTPMITDTALLGWTVKATANRFTETPGRAILSALSVGVMNTTAHNHSTHCVIAVAFTNRLTPGVNHSLLFNQECAVFQKELQGRM